MDEHTLPTAAATTHSAISSREVEPREGSQFAIMGSGASSSSNAHVSQVNMDDGEYENPTAYQGAMALVKSSWINVLVVFIPLGIASHFVWNSTVTFILNFIAIIPLAKLLGFATEDIALRTGEVNIRTMTWTHAHVHMHDEYMCLGVWSG